MTDPLSPPANTITTPLLVRITTAAEPDLFLDGDRFMAYLNASYDSFDVMTFSCSKAYLQPLKGVNRLIYGLKQRNTCIKPREKRYMMNNHVKLFICRKTVAVADIAVYVGSQNLTHGTNLNLMYRVRGEHVQPLVDFFEQLWKSL